MQVGVSEAVEWGAPPDRHKMITERDLNENTPSSQRLHP